MRTLLLILTPATTHLNDTETGWRGVQGRINLYSIYLEVSNRRGSNIVPFPGYLSGDPAHWPFHGRDTQYV